MTEREDQAAARRAARKAERDRVAAEARAAYIRETVDAFPPPSPELLETIRVLIRPGVIAAQKAALEKARAEQTASSGEPDSSGDPVNNE